jgi:diketogulonate reductase-like aldo/keto reductase
MMILDESFTLANGVTIPKLGLGTWLVEDGKAAQAVRDAAGIGYRHFDTAQAYGNERGVGEAVRTCGVAREALFVTTKLQAACKTYAGAKAAIDGSLTALGLEHIDLMIIHSPQPWAEFGGAERYLEGNRQAWRALEEAYAAGKVRAIGVSNFEQVDLENILGSCSVRPMVNQILAHVGNTPFELIAACQGQGILVEAYSPVGHGAMLNDRNLALMAKKYGVTTPQLCIGYCLQLGMLPLPKTTNAAHMRTNAAVDFEISEADMETLKRAERIRDYGEASVFPVYGGRS